MKEELERLESSNFKLWQEDSEVDDVYFASLAPLFKSIGTLADEISALPREEKAEAREELKGMKADFRARAKEINDANKVRMKEVKRAVKELTKLEEEREQKLSEINNHGDREIALIQEAAKDLIKICSDPEEARRYFAVADKTELEENEFNLNLPRYVNTFDPEEEIPIELAMAELNKATKAGEEILNSLNEILCGFRRE